MPSLAGALSRVGTIANATTPLDLREILVERYQALARGFCKIKAPDLAAAGDDAYAGQRYTPTAYVQISPAFQPGHTVEGLVRDGTLHPACADLLRAGKPEGARGISLELHPHQDEEIALAKEANSFVATTSVGYAHITQRRMRRASFFVDATRRCSECPRRVGRALSRRRALRRSRLGAFRAQRGRARAAVFEINYTGIVHSSLTNTRTNGVTTTVQNDKVGQIITGTFVLNTIDMDPASSVIEQQVFPSTPGGRTDSTQTYTWDHNSPVLQFLTSRDTIDGTTTQMALLKDLTPNPQQSDRFRQGLRAQCTAGRPGTSIG